ncbi:probable LRR receptor-like serine/threonine-protein kinase At1g05700 [Telopea speciosissima]|uniref:probable LRR receptor-like serine/threonine-protein kinase At1g05700 n=1 Tax=Telopea speciosissima TaxID=54955 RepID=UPI001CC5EA02|nr:probable LRR receptor-like serine/threonine-protein kinase At1g05700 [Telopea speciosissima]
MANDHIFFLLLSLHAIAASAQSLFLSLDCGSSSSSVYTDAIGITWTGDDSYINTGENKVVQTPNSVSEVMNTLRVFSTRKKNCYSIPFTKGTKALVRASFYYGNYDKKSSPPTFAILLDGNRWATVKTSIGIDLHYVEAVFVERSDSISVCLAQTHPNQLPFISSLEVRTLESTLYPDDLYDRIWFPARRDNRLMTVSMEQLSLLQTQFSVLAGWSGDPCLPSPYTWDWIAYTSDATPRITALYLSGYGLSGTLPDFSSMVALQTM